MNRLLSIFIWIGICCYYFGFYFFIFRLLSLSLFRRCIGLCIWCIFLRIFLFSFSYIHYMDFVWSLLTVHLFVPSSIRSEVQLCGTVVGVANAVQIDTHKTVRISKYWQRDNATVPIITIFPSVTIQLTNAKICFIYTAFFFCRCRSCVATSHTRHLFFFGIPPPVYSTCAFLSCQRWHTISSFDSLLFYCIVDIAWDGTFFFFSIAYYSLLVKWTKWRK